MQKKNKIKKSKEMKEVHLDKNERIEDVKKEEEELKIYGELTLGNINSLRKLYVKKLDLSNSNNSSFPDFVFLNFTSLTNIILPESINSIGNYSFYCCENLKEVDMSICSSLKSLNIGFLRYCYSLSNNKLPDSLNEISDYAFERCLSLKSIILPKSLKRIGESAFLGCMSLKVINLPSSINKIGSYAFNWCNSLEEIEIPKTVSIITTCVFSKCKSLKKVKLYNEIKIIEDGAFFGCSSLEKINLPNSLKQINSRAFENCSCLQKIEIPESIESIGLDLFKGCNSLEEIKVDPRNKFYHDKDGVLFNKDKTVLIKFPAKKGVLGYCIPETVKIIEENAFESCDFIQRITQADTKYLNGVLKIPLLLNKIKCDAFNNCRNIRKLELLTDINLNKRFEYCNSLSYIKITKKVFQSNTYFLSNTQGKNIISIDNGFIYFESKYYSNHRKEIKVFGLYNGNVYFKQKNLILYHLSDYVEPKVEFKFIINAFNNSYLFSWIF